MNSPTDFPESLAPEPDFSYRDAAGLEVHFAVERPGILFAQPAGVFTAESGIAWVENLLLLVEADFGGGMDWALLIDLSRVSQRELSTRLACFDRLKAAPRLRACAYVGATRLMRFMLELGVAFQSPPFAVCFEAGVDRALAAARALRVSGTAPAPDPRPALSDPRNSEDVLELFAAVAWAQGGGEALSVVPNASPWRPVADAMGLIKRDLDLLIGESRDRLRQLRSDLESARKLGERRERALIESERLSLRVEEEGERRLALTQDRVRQQKDLLFALGEIIESRSRETANHIHRVSAYARHLALLCGLPEREATLIFHAAPMHDAGKLAIPDRILSKPGPLDADERRVMEGHARLGYDLLRGGSRGLLGTASVIAHEHHERWNGKGYPRGLRGDAIHPYGRLAALADVFDALGSDRCYKKAWPLEKILALLHAERGEQFEPRLIDLFFKNLGAFRQIRDAYPDEVA
ncbi:MAG: HD domain-containing protein [Spirochaetes bacterium]|nr:HD domain-containing protein [Spirochaetota bacterium]